MITHHTQLLNYLIARYGLKSYCELGVQNPKNNFDKIIAENRVGVDPCLTSTMFNKVKDGQPWYMVENTSYHVGMTSDDYFASDLGKWKFDICFIDGLHHADQVKKDFENSLRCLNDGGFIVLHDTLPQEEVTTCVPRGSQKVWHGDVYKFAMQLSTYDEIDFITLNSDCGCTIVWKEPRYSRTRHACKVDWDYYLKNRKEVLNIIEPMQIETKLPVRATHA